MSVSCGVDRRHGSDPQLLWLWCRPEAIAPIRPLAGNLYMPWVRPRKDRKKEREREREREKDRQKERGAWGLEEVVANHGRVGE